MLLIISFKNASILIKPHSHDVFFYVSYNNFKEAKVISRKGKVEYLIYSWKND